ncbi:Protoporphyrinogen oxidase [Coniochaeta ligniaria NRRL 30616]|uniref:Protoporphyrinogen oxidase n=1 Tax=Coniochaeta ligniaria NRRL 30616 TaxID=1408157 RepID=A0A1J7J394_9PEZI|nr:Protoporphyrinogen oxidase [Coniochaeta ligniaria NRRL 30616]
MVLQSSHGARVALSAVRVCTPRHQPCRTPSTTRRLTTTRRPRDARPRDARPLAVEQRHSSDSRRSYATVGTKRPKDIAVLGGGLTGLSTAWYLTKFMPEAKVTIYEGSGRMGGWIDSETVEVTGADGTKGTVVFERGARLVQPKTGVQNWDDIAFFELREEWLLTVCVEEQMSDVKPDGDPWKGFEAYDRYFYYPDHLVCLPAIPGASDPVGMLLGLAQLAVSSLREPLYEGAHSFLWNMLRSTGNRPPIDDVSIGEEFLRRGGRREPVDNMLSAMCHGIYGGDVWKLSAESSIFGAAFMNQRLRWPYSSVWEAWKKTRIPVLIQDNDLLRQVANNRQVVRWLEYSKVIKSFNFGQGFSALTDGLVAKLKAKPNVKFVNEKVDRVRHSAAGRMEVTTAKRTRPHDKVISSLYSKTLASLAPRNSLPSLAKSTAVTIRLVNLWSPTPNLNHKTKGFGYLLPGTVPAEQNPHAALGVIFDSDRTPYHPSNRLPPSAPARHHLPCRGDTVPGTKLTVMLGGHHWDDIPPHFLPDAATDDAAAVAAAKETVRIQMGIDPSHWQAAGTKLCVDCIPQHLVGHAKRMEAADRELRAAFKGKLAVVGGSYTAQGVVGSIRAARDVAYQVSDGFRGTTEVKRGSAGLETFREPTKDGAEVSWTVGDTGLARFVGGTAKNWYTARVSYIKKFRTPAEGPRRVRSES